jgi:hypothetical protein
MQRGRNRGELNGVAIEVVLLFEQLCGFAKMDHG